MSSLGAQERRIAEYLLINAESIEKEPLTDLAKKSEVSEATIVRLCHKIGYSGVKELKIVIAREHNESGQALKFNTNIDGMDELKQNVFIGSIRAIQDTLNLIDDEQIELATAALCKANHITIYAVGGSVPVATSFKHQFMKLGIPSYVYNEFMPSIIAAEKYTRNDVAIAITHSGETQEVVAALESARSKGATTICITSYGDSSITKCADIKFFTTSEALMNQNDNSLARIAETSIVNLLYCNVALKYNQYQESKNKE